MTSLNVLAAAVFMFLASPGYACDFDSTGREVLSITGKLQASAKNLRQTAKVLRGSDRDVTQHITEAANTIITSALPLYQLFILRSEMVEKSDEAKVREVLRKYLIHVGVHLNTQLEFSNQMMGMLSTAGASAQAGEVIRHASALQDTIRSCVR